MAPEGITCPYCNSVVPGGGPAGQRCLCPRCGEQFTLRSSAGAPTEAPAPAPMPTDPEVPMPRTFSNRSVVLAILGIMTMMGVVGLLLSLETQSFRRANDAQIAKPAMFGIPLAIKIVSTIWMIGLALLLMGFWRRPEGSGDEPAPRARWIYGVGISLAILSAVMILFSGPLRRRNSQGASGLEQPAVRSLDPQALEALRYLPPDTNVVAGVHVAELLQDPRSKEFLDGLRIAALQFNSERLEGWTGMKRDDVDHVVVGLRLEDQLLPRLIVIARSRGPLDPEVVREKLKGTPGSDPNRFHFKVTGTNLEAEARCVPADQLVIVALSRTDLDAVPVAPHAGIDALSPKLSQMLAKRVDRHARAWAIGQVSDWDRTGAIALWMQSRPDFKPIRSFGTWLVFEDPLVVRAEIECTNEAAARKLVFALDENRIDAIQELKAPKPHDEWVSVQARMKANIVQEAFQK